MRPLHLVIHARRRRHHIEYIKWTRTYNYEKCIAELMSRLAFDWLSIYIFSGDWDWKRKMAVTALNAPPSLA